MILIASVYCFVLDIIVQMKLLKQYLAQTNIHKNISVIVNSFRMESQPYFINMLVLDCGCVCLIKNTSFKLVVKMCGFTTLWS